MWIVLGITTIILLVVYWKSRNAVWGGFSAGIIVGLILSLVGLFKGNGFNLYTIGKAAIIGSILGFGAELLGMVGDLFKKSKVN